MVLSASFFVSAGATETFTNKIEAMSLTGESTSRFRASATGDTTAIGKQFE